HRLGRGAQAVQHRAFGGAERLMALVADEPLFLLRMDTDIAPASLASGRAVPIGAESGCGVHDAPPGCAWTHCHEEYVWTPVCFTTSPYHGLVWSYQHPPTHKKTPVFGTHDTQPNSGTRSCTETQSKNQRRVSRRWGSFWTTCRQGRFTTAIGSTLMVT